MAYAAVISLKQTLERLHYDDYYSGPPLSERIRIRYAHEEVKSLQEVLEVLDCLSKNRMKTWDLVEPHLLKHFPAQVQFIQFAYKDVNSLEKYLRMKVDVSDIGRIGEAVHKLEHVFESLVIKLEQAVPPDQVVSVDDLDRARQEINSFTQTMNKIINQKNSKEEDDCDGKKSNMVNLWDEFPKTQDLIPEIWEFAHEVLKNLQEVLRRLDMNRSNRSRERVNALDEQIREAICEIEDLLETHVSNQLLPQFEESLEDESSQPLMSFFVDIEEFIHQYIDPFTQLVNKLKKGYINELLNYDDDDDDDDDTVSSLNYFDGKKSKMVGLHDEFSKIMDKLSRGWSRELKFFTLVGMGGIGKTIIAKEVFEHLSMLQSFQLRAWVKVGPKYQLKEMMQSIIAQVCPQVEADKILTKGDGRLEEYLYQSLKGKRYLIVLDDVWNTSVWVDMKRLFPDDNNRSLILLTTRLERLSRLLNSHKIRFLSKEESWDLLREKVFGQESCPPLLEEAGKKIAEHREGLPLTIVTVGNLLSNVNKTLENWNKVAEYQNSLLDDAYEQVTKVLLPSYNYLNQCSKACFLYMGSFPQNYDISRSELIKLWSTDILFYQSVNRSEVFLIIEDLVYNSLLIPGTKSFTVGIKTWSLHSSFWHLCKREACKNKFFHVINSYADGLSECVKGQRRLCIHNNVLFVIKDVYKSMSSISTARSLICTSPSHQYPVPICFSLKLLRILNVLTIHFYEFPMEVMKLIQLRYLALTFYGNFPSSISNFLWNLEYLIVCRHMDIKSFGAPSYLPMEIWNMKELKHLQVMGSNLPDPCSDTLLPNLITLLDVGPHS